MPLTHHVPRRASWFATSASLAVLLAVGAAAAALAQTPSRQPCAAPEHRQFDFWVGDWDVATPDGKPAGRNRVELVLNGCVIFENWEGAGGAAGKSFSLYETGARQWTQTWVDGSGTRIVFTGGLDGPRMVMKNAWTGRDGRRFRSEISWAPLPDGRVRQTWRQSADDGASWTVSFDGIYTKRPAA